MKTSLIEKFADKFGIEPNKMLASLNATAFKQKDETSITNEQMMALLVVANEYGLNPWTKEIYAFPTKGGGIVPIVGVDGWCRIINENKNFDGMEVSQSDKTVTLDGGKECPVWMECSIHRKDRSHPTVIREYLDEVYRPPFKPRGKDYVVDGPWQTHTKRFLRHKTMIQCARIAFGFSGVYDQDEGERIIEGENLNTIKSIESESAWEGDINKYKVESIATTIRLIINKDKTIDDDYLAVQELVETCNMNEHMFLSSLLNDKPSGSRKKYKTILQDYLNYAPSNEEVNILHEREGS